MVMKLPQPDVCSLKLLDDVIARQRGENAIFFNGIAKEWYARVQAYIQHDGSPVNVLPWKEIEPHRQKFLNLYASKANSVQKTVITQMRNNHELNHCPACGEPGRPNTLDHYLPKNVYPHLCITPLNLFPMCDACQTRKGTKIGDTNSPRFFIHPYFDVFVAEQVIELRFYPPYNAPKFTLSCREGLLDEQTRLIESHMRELELEKRYLNYFKGQYMRLLRLVERLRNL
jgi:5-methylcytosine-specific restriction endonuclease McrA